MPFNGSGTFIRVYNWVTDKINGVNITASRVDTEDDGFAAGLTNCVTRDGQGRMGAAFLPDTDNAYPLGNGSNRWSDIVTAAFRTQSGTVQGFGPVGSAFFDMTPDLANFTASYTGFTGGVTASALWGRVGPLIFVVLQPCTGTSNANTFVLANLPPSIRTATTQIVPVAAAALTDNGAGFGSTGASGSAQISGSTISFIKNTSTSAWTPSGTKAISLPITLSYFLT